MEKPSPDGTISSYTLAVTPEYYDRGIEMPDNRLMWRKVECF